MEKAQPEAYIFSNLLAVFGGLQKDGWKISRAGLYKHHREGKIRQRTDGMYHLKDVAKYARTFLKRKDTGKRLQDEQDDLQRKKTRLEVEKLETEVARAKHKQEVEQGAYIPRDQLEIELASRAAVLDAGLSHFFQSEAGSWINLVGGDRRKLPELVSVLMATKDGFMNQYARAKEFTVEIMGDTREGDE